VNTKIGRYSNCAPSLGAPLEDSVPCLAADFSALPPVDSRGEELNCRKLSELLGSMGFGTCQYPKCLQSKNMGPRTSGNHGGKDHGYNPPGYGSRILERSSNRGCDRHGFRSSQSSHAPDANARTLFILIADAVALIHKAIRVRIRQPARSDSS